jgi:hypothetical protein
MYNRRPPATKARRRQRAGLIGATLTRCSAKTGLIPRDVVLAVLALEVARPARRPHRRDSTRSSSGPRRPVRGLLPVDDPKPVHHPGHVPPRGAVTWRAITQHRSHSQQARDIVLADAADGHTATKPWRRQRAGLVGATSYLGRRACTTYSDPLRILLRPLGRLHSGRQQGGG